ncbi:MAG: class I SAM-dependent methyltransferase [Candidatus Aenigmarchaeota archaeon]|nr:class I SAM-dependent methyltransferase [Candidatus Aenigmarchaeota archaeon]
MKKVSCNLCGSNNYVLIDSHKNDKYFPPDVEVKTVVCKNCSLVYRNPQPTKRELFDFYSHSYRKDLPTKKYITSSNIINKERLEWFNSHVKLRCGKILDVGCSTGNFLNLCKSKGWETYGIEPTIEYAKFGREKYKLNIQSRFLEDARFQKSFFDVITLFQVLEHSRNPTKVLLQLKNWLKPNGLIYITVPNILKPDKIELAKYFAGPHLFFFSPNTLSLLFKKTGFEIVALEEIKYYVRIIGKKRGKIGKINFDKEGDDYKKIMRNLKWRYTYLIPKLLYLKVVKLIKKLIILFFGEAMGDKIINFLKQSLFRKIKTGK